MSTQYTDGAKALIYSIIAAIVLAIGAIVVLIISLTAPEPRRIQFKSLELIPIQRNDDYGCQFERILQVIAAEDIGGWLEESRGDTVCLRKKPDGFWEISAFKSPKKIQPSKDTR